MKSFLQKETTAIPSPCIDITFGLLRHPKAFLESATRFECILTAQVPQDQNSIQEMVA